ncbi:MAG: hypothetical protein KJ857_11905, partial [Proteobacteria bacterium]|nr:hypothetical protein [Pseudomonadota bacterium]
MPQARVYFILQCKMKPALQKGPFLPRRSFGPIVATSPPAPTPVPPPLALFSLDLAAPPGLIIPSHFARIAQMVEQLIRNQ